MNDYCFSNREKFKNEQKRQAFMSKFENIAQENIEELINNFMSIHDTEYLHKIWTYLNQENQQEINLDRISEKFLKYFYQEIDSMLNGSNYRPFIDEQWFYHLLLLSIHRQDHNMKYFDQIFHFMKKFNSKLKDKSQLSYIPFLGRIIQRLIKENYQQIQSFYSINNEFLYNLYLSLILGNDYNTDEINLNYFIEIHSISNIQLTLKQLSRLIQSCLMTKNSDICFKFLEYLSNIEICQDESKSTIDYIIQFLSAIIRTTVYELDEINRRIKFKREFSIKNGETIFDLRAKLTIRQSNSEENENVQQAVR